MNKPITLLLTLLLSGLVFLLGLASPQVTTATENSDGKLYGLTSIVASDTAPANSFGVERVLCPAGMVAIGGGIDMENVLTMRVTSSAPVFADEEGGEERLITRPDGTNPAPIGWQASALNEAGTAQSFKVTAICAPLANVSVVVASDTAPAGSFAPERVLCPTGETAIGGGIDMDNVLLMQVTSSAPTFPDDSMGNERLITRPDGTNPAPIGWQASAFNDAGDAQSFKVAVICTSLADVSTVVTSDTASAGSFGTARILCPDDTVAIGGGIDLNNVLTMQVSSSAPAFPSENANGERLIFRPDGNNPAPIGQQASAINSEGVAQPFNVATICVPLEFRIFLPMIIK